MIKTRLESLLIGQPQPFRGNGEMSAIRKREVGGPVHLGLTGLAGNQVADTVHHGGPDKAVHLYPREHYSFWRERYPDVDDLAQWGAFGENFSCTGMTEDQLCLGDEFRVGEAVIQCSHARQPCSKLNHRFGKSDVVKTVIQTTRSGSYFRVLETGSVQAGDLIELLERPLPEWPLERVFRLVLGGDHKDDREALRILADIPQLAEDWRNRAHKLLKS